MAFNNELVILNQYKELLDDNSIVTKTDIKGIITFVNEKFCKISGYSKDELLGKSHNIVRHPDMPKEVFKELWDTIKHKRKTWHGIIKNKNKNGKPYYVDATIKPIINEKGEIVEFIAMRFDVTELMSPRRLLFDELSNNKKLLLVMVEINEYETLQKLYGKDIAKMISDNFGKHLIDYCPVGCEFNKIFNFENGVFALVKELDKNEKNPAETHIIPLKKFQQNIKDSVLEFGGYEYELSVILSYSVNKKNIYEDVVAGLKKAKEDKIDFIYASGITERESDKAKNNLKMVNKIKKAIKEDRIISLFQPIIDINNKSISKYESLVRLKEENGKLLSPFFFLDIAKESKYYHQITEIVINNSLKKLRETNKEISINLSTLDIEDVELRNKIINLITTNADIAPRLVVELLEDEATNDFSVIKDFISFIKMFGVKIAIDDFGSGYSNFTRLLEFQPDILKIDGSLIKDIHNDEYSKNIVETIISFVKKQNIKVVTEFVSSKEAYDVVKNLGVDFVQGYLFGEPKIDLADKPLNENLL